MADATRTAAELHDVAVVVIGRNEGERLRRCLVSVADRAGCLVYVDSGSTDGSPAVAAAHGAIVVDLDLTQGFTAARARNAGLACVQQHAPQTAFVQFVDGDCEVEAGWLAAARTHLAEEAALGVVFGRRRERFPDRSPYNRLCDIEWDVPRGEVLYCGGDAMFRKAAIVGVGGYRSDLIAGEEPELCIRLRRAGWRVLSTGEPMTVHDAAMTRFGQWWKRAMRSGYAFAEGAFLHGGGPERHWVAATHRIWAWGVALPGTVAIAAATIGPWALMLLSAYPLQMARLYLKRRSTEPHAHLTSVFHVLGRLPEAVGLLKFHTDRLRSRKSALLEYK